MLFNVIHSLILWVMVKELTHTVVNANKEAIGKLLQTFALKIVPKLLTPQEPMSMHKNADVN